MQIIIFGKWVDVLCAADSPVDRIASELRYCVAVLWYAQRDIARGLGELMVGLMHQQFCLNAFDSGELFI